jgi:ABC-2 type transport system ATP-binding protein
MTPPATIAHHHDRSVELRDVKKSFRTSHGTVRAVRGLDVSVARGETLALLGPNGAGKSTTIDMLLGLTTPDGGYVEVLGQSPGDAVRDELVGAMLQTGAIVRDVSVRDLVTMYASLYASALDADEVLDLTGVADIAGHRTQKLSGGQAQRLRFALAIVSDPELLVLDEPTVGLDVESRRAFWSAIRRFAAQGRTVIFATHYLEEADAYADRAVLLAHGRAVAQGSTTELRARAGHRRVRATLPDADAERLGELPGVIDARRRGEAIELVCDDSDAAVRALLWQHPAARDLEIEAARLEDAFIVATGPARDREPAP